MTTHSSSSVVPDRPPLVEETHSYDAPGNRTNKLDARPGALWANRDFAFTYDGLLRLTVAQRGINGGSFTPGIGGQQWDLDMLGNWSEVRTDNDGDGNHTESGEKDTRTHNEANELLSRVACMAAH